MLLVSNLNDSNVASSSDIKEDLSGCNNDIKSLTESHRSRLEFKYGIDKTHPEIRRIIELGQLRSITTSEELRRLLERDDVDGTGIFIQYPNSNIFTIRLDDPVVIGDREVKYLRPAGQTNGLYNPGLKLENTPEIWVTEGELKALSGYVHGFPVVAISGIWNWRSSGEELLSPGDRLEDREALIPDLRRDWTGKKVILLYDSDITPNHQAYDAFPRLAEQLYRLEASEVRIVTLPALPEVEGKTGLDDLLLLKGDEAKDILGNLISRQDPYLPLRDGAVTYAERLIRSQDLEDRLKAATSYYAARGEMPLKEWLRGCGTKLDDIKSYLRDAKARLKQYRKNKLSPSQLSPDPRYEYPLALLKDTRYTISGRSLCKLERKGNGGEEVVLTKPLCNFVAYPLRQVVKDNGLEKERLIEIAGIGPNCIPFPSATIPLTSFPSMNWIAPTWGARASIETGWSTRDELRHCIQSMVTKDTPEEVVYTHLGWRKLDDHWVYLHAGMGSRTLVEPHRKLTRYKLPEDVNDPEEALRLSLSLLDVASRNVTIPLLSLVALAPLCEPLRIAGIEPGFLMWLFGLSGSMKSTLAALFLSHFGQFDNKTLPCSFRDTAASLENVTFSCKDSLLVIDDYYPSSNFRDKERLDNTAQQVVRAFGDRTGRGRMNANMTSRETYPPRGMGLATGEEVLQGQSTLARLFVLELAPGSVNKDNLSKAQARQDLLPAAMKGYLDWLAPQMDSLPQELATSFKELRGKAQTEGRHSRLPEAVAHLYIGFNMFLNFAEFRGGITAEEAHNLAQEAWEVLNQTVDRQSETVRDQQPAQKFFAILQDLLVQGKVYLAGPDGAAPHELEGVPGVQQIGWLEDEVAYLSMGTAYTAAYQYCRDQGEDFPVKKGTLIKHIEQQGLVVQSQGSSARNVIKKRFADKTYRVLPVKAGYLEVE